MPASERVKQFIEWVESGRWEEALQEFYTDEAEMSENLSEPTRGRAANLAREREFASNIRQIHEYRAESHLVGQDESAIHWIMEITTVEGQRLRFDEVAWQTWSGDRIARERFVYDPNTLKVASA